MSPSEVDLINKLERDYLQSLVNLGIDIPKEKVGLFRTLFLRQYLNEQTQVEEPEKSDKQKKKSKAKVTKKFASLLAKDFNIHIHTQNLLREDPAYL